MTKNISLFCSTVAIGIVLYFLIFETFNSFKNQEEFEYLSLEEHLSFDKQESEKYNSNIVDGKEIIINSKNDSLLLYRRYSNLLCASAGRMCMMLQRNKNLFR